MLLSLDSKERRSERLKRAKKAVGTIERFLLVEMLEGTEEAADKIRRQMMNLVVGLRRKLEAMED